MKRFLFTAVVVFLAACFTPVIVAEDETTVSGDERFIDVSELERGMTGYGLSVFSGTKIEKFDCEVISVVKNNQPRLDMVLVMMSGCGLEKSGIIEGMSGSPIFIGEYPNGRLLGALAYGWNFNKEPIAGITPIKSMLELGQRKWRRKIASAAAPEAAASEMSPVAAPLAFGGFTERVFRNAAAAFEKRGFTCYKGGSGSGSREEVTRLEPGSVLTIPMITGDFDISTSGTVTWVDGDKVYAFGHPLYEEGEIAIPFGGGYVDYVVKLMTSSFKMTGALKPLGTIKQDRLPGVFGEVGTYPALIPVSIRVKNPKEGADNSFNLGVMQAYDWTDMLLSIAINNAVASVEASVKPSVVNSRVAIKIKDVKEPLVLVDTMESGWGPVPYGLLSPISRIINNRYKEVLLESIDIELDIEIADKGVYIYDAYLDKNTVEPGEEVDVHVVLEPYRAERFIRTVKVRIPKDAEEGRLALAISSGADLTSGVIPGDSFEKMLENLRKLYTERFRYSVLAVSIADPEPRMAFEEKEITGMPESALDTLVRSSRKRVLSFSREKVFSINTEYLINGWETLFVVVKKKSTR